jgi:hypothetical protein
MEANMLTCGIVPVRVSHFCGGAQVTLSLRRFVQSAPANLIYAFGSSPTVRAHTPNDRGAASVMLTEGTCTWVAVVFIRNALNTSSRALL